MSYLRSVYLQKDKSIFKIDELPVERFAESLGLPGAPMIKFLGKDAVKRRKNASRAVEAAQAEVRQEKENLKHAEGLSASEKKGIEEESTSESSEGSGDSDSETVEAQTVPIAPGKASKVWLCGS